MASIIIEIGVSIGELIDKMTILEIKMLELKSPEKLANATLEYSLLQKVFCSVNFGGEQLATLRNGLFEVNKEIWVLEERLRAIDPILAPIDYSQTSSRIHSFNDKRFLLKNEINNCFGSKITEVKSWN